jgi:catechol 2,3-dioxygenase-like lactoylglutathione lyase family enzyme
VIGEHITFIYVANLEASHRFYHGVLGLPLALDQGACRIYRVTATSYLGVCDHREPSPEGVIVTFVTDDVEGWHARLAAAGAPIQDPPTYNARFDVYQFFARDPDGHLIEIQRFGAPGAGSPFLGPGPPG